MTGKYSPTTSKCKKEWNRRSNPMDADKLEKVLKYMPLSARAKHVGRYLRLKKFFACREGIVAL